GDDLARLFVADLERFTDLGELRDRNPRPVGQYAHTAGEFSTQREVLVQPRVRLSIPHRDAQVVTKMVLGVPRDVHAVSSALFALVLRSHGRCLSRVSFSDLEDREPIFCRAPSPTKAAPPTLRTPRRRKFALHFDNVPRSRACPREPLPDAEKKVVGDLGI